MLGRSALYVRRMACSHVVAAPRCHGSTSAIVRRLLSTSAHTSMANTNCSLLRSRILKTRNDVRTVLLTRSLFIQTADTPNPHSKKFYPGYGAGSRQNLAQGNGICKAPAFTQTISDGWGRDVRVPETGGHERILSGAESFPCGGCVPCMVTAGGCGRPARTPLPLLGR
jgi:hypothetical protein